MCDHRGRHPTPKADTSERASHEITVETDTYDEGRDALARQVPDGWRISYLRVDR